METYPVATHDGEMIIGEKKIPCAVLEDGRRVLTQQGFLRAIGRARSAKGGQGSSVDVIPFLAAKNLQAFINEDLHKQLRPLEFRTTGGRLAYGFPAEAVPNVCNIYLAARDKGALHDWQKPVAIQCDILLRAIATVGIVALVDEATGFQKDRPTNALQAYLDVVLRKELAAWAKTFPDAFYENIYSLKGWKWPGMKKNRYSVVASYTKNLIYNRLGAGILTELEQRTPKKENGRRSNKMHQWLSDDIGHPKLAQHMHTIIKFQELAISRGYSWQRFLHMVDEVLPESTQTPPLPMLVESETTST